MEAFVVGAYMVCAVFFILSLGGLSNQESAKRGNFYGVIAMILAITATLFVEEFNGRYLFFFPAFVLGGVVGLGMALKVEMISMPQMVAALHSFVGLAATMVSFASYLLHPDQTNLEIIEINIGVFIGAITFSGSVVAWGKLQEVIRSKPLIICGWFRHVINLMFALGCLACAIYYAIEEDHDYRLYALLANAGLSCFIGWHLVMAIGGADMPVVVSMLNSYSGWATSASGFLLQDELLIITGALVGSSGAILSYIMCKAMNRSFFNVIAGGFGEGTAVAAQAAQNTKVTGTLKPITLHKMVDLLRDAHNIIIVPGYGMAVARCQHDVGTLADFLIKTGRKVRFCIHPVAGRLPGHMNVLLAEADVDYSIVKEMDHLNKEFSEVDLALVIGANDIVNPDALENPQSPIAGMPVCEVWNAKDTVVFKRGGGAGYAGIENPLFFKDNTHMFYGSADKSIKEILNQVTTLKEVFIETGGGVEYDDSADEEEALNKPEEVFPEPTKQIGVPNEIYPLENRVAMAPDSVKLFRRLGFRVLVESGAGKGANFPDEAYAKEGAIISSTEEVWNSEIVLKVRKPDYHPVLGRHEDTLLENTRLLVSYVYPASNADWLKDLAKRYPKLTYMAMDCVPRITKAQKLDSLSSMGSIAGYRAVVEAFHYYKKTPKPMVTAAGKIPPTKVLVIGAGVAGLAAIGYSRSLGCIVSAMDTRSAAKSDAESMGAHFVEVPIKEEGAVVGGYAKVMSENYQKAQYDVTKKTAAKCDIVITTALIPGRKAPILMDAGIVKSMKYGSVIVDLAAEQGGNVEGTRAGEAVFTDNGVTIVGFTDLTSRMAPQSSELYTNNLYNLLDDLLNTHKFKVNLDDEIIGPMVVIHEGEYSYQPPKAVPAPPKPNVETPGAHPSKKKQKHHWSRDFKMFIVAAVAIGLFVGLSYATYGTFMRLFMTFVLAIFIGYMVIWNVTPALHTPLMSVTNAISGIIVIGSMLLLDPTEGTIDEGSGIAIASVFFASINIFGGFTVTQRMLSMFKTDKKKKKNKHHDHNKKEKKDKKHKH
ncbi:unnamed protein product [Blepharisma stoltei]|uniref:proton-translocating NAD(P)(+) transhydrogenase n=1 Tax=Blepharisma stoltei TaxID=1481888 RepID=A0AAU9ISD5_9CILI|nr:unnamed protein product [Blepharisma stoltei]